MPVLDWLETRTGARSAVRTALHEAIPGGARWRYVWGSTLAFVFGLQVVTGVLLMTVYSPSASTAWGSVWYIQTQVSLGWLVRGLHHFGSHAMIILLPIHILQVVLARAYRRPREVNWWLGLALLAIVLALGLTGYLLPWDQKGFWATKVATNIMGLTPLIGPTLQVLVTGGQEYGHGTLTRFYTLHVWVLPASFVALLIAHVAVFRRHGVTVAPRHAIRPAGWFWPDQAARDLTACLAVFAALLAAVLYTHFVARDPLLAAPADPASGDYPARPEWYFLFLFQLLKYFEGPVLEVVGAIVLPGLVAAALAALPLLDRVLPAALAHRCATALTIGLFVTAGWLTWAAVRDDRPPTSERFAAALARQESGADLSDDDRQILRARLFNRQRIEARRLADRALELAATRGIPPEGPLALLAGDAVARGPGLFAAHCAVCHRFDGHDGTGTVPPVSPAAADLAGFASGPWVRRLLENPAADAHFGLIRTEDGRPLHIRMSDWVAQRQDECGTPEDLARLAAEFDAAAEYLADERSHPGRWAAVTGAADPATFSPDPAHQQVVRGRLVFLDQCSSCHPYDGAGGGLDPAPDLYGYGSVAWIERMIAAPDHVRNYGPRARMPGFESLLTDRDRRLLAEWLHASRMESLP